MAVVYTSAPIVLRAMDKVKEQFDGGYYQGISLKELRLQGQRGNIVDFQHHEDVGILLRVFYREIREAKRTGSTVQMCVSGGRKVMGIMAMVAAQLLFGPQDKVWHLVTEGWKPGDEQLMHPEDTQVRDLVEVPVLLWEYASLPLGQADFAMSKIAVNEAYGGSVLRKAIDYFCHLARTPEFFASIQNDKEFAASEFFSQMSWLGKENDSLYDPSYTDMLRVAFTSEFKRGRLGDLVALLSGRNFETRQYEERIVEESFSRLKKGVSRFINETHFKRFALIVCSAGFVDASMIGSQNALNFAYILYLTLRDMGMPNEDIEHNVRRWFVFSILTGRYSGAPETAFDHDIRQIHAQGIASYADNLIRGELSDAFWEVSLPQAMDTSVAYSPYFRLFQAAQVKMNDLGFLSKDITVRELIEVRSDVHHLFPREYLKKHGLARGQYNQIANYVVAQSEINIAIGSKEPREYFEQLLDQCHGGPKRYGNITDPDTLHENLRMHCIPDAIEQMTADDYPNFLTARRRLIAQKIRVYFESL